MVRLVTRIARLHSQEGQSRQNYGDLPTLWGHAIAVVTCFLLSNNVLLNMGLG
jgi:hypothetical protein